MVVLGVSFNAQSQAPDIPGASSRVDFLRDTAYLQDQSKDPDIYTLCASTEELLTSLNAQDQVPDDLSQIFSFGLSFPVVARVYGRALSASFNAQDQAPDDLHALDRSSMYFRGMFFFCFPLQK